MNRPSDPTPSTEKTLIAIASGRCEFRDCTNDIVTNQKFLGEIAHIAAVKPGGPRYDKHLSTEQIRKIDNLLLLCPNHHGIIDNIILATTLAIVNTRVSIIKLFLFTHTDHD